MKLPLSWLKEYLTSFKPGEAKTQTKHVVTSFLLSNGKILLLRRSDRVGTYRGRWGAVSGYVEEKPPDQQALIEIKEETGLGANDIEFMCKGDTVTVQDDKLKTRWIIHPYLFLVKNQEKIKLDWEHKESKWISPEEVKDYDTVPQLKETLEAAMARQYGN